MDETKDNAASALARASAGACACALALALPASTLAYADEQSREYPLEITAEAVQEGESVLSVTVPSSVSIVVRTSVVDGRVLSFDASPARIENSARSFSAVSAEIVAVEDTPSGGGKLLDYVDITFRGHHDVAIAEGSGQHAPLFDAIEPGEGETLEVDLAQRRAEAPVPKGTYGTSATIKVAAL